MGLGMGSLCGAIIRASLRDANNIITDFLHYSVRGALNKSFLEKLGRWGGGGSIKSQVFSNIFQKLNLPQKYTCDETQNV